MKTPLFTLLFFLATRSAFCQGWVTVGNPGFTHLGSGQTSIHGFVFDKNATPYIATQYDINQVIVMKFDRSGWITLGNGPLPSSGANLPSLAFDSSGSLYIAFANSANHFNGPASVMKLNGNHWEFLGDTIVSPSSTDNVSIAFNKQNVAYIAYSDLIDQTSAILKVSVKKFDGNIWQQVGIRGFSDGRSAETTSITIDNNGIPYVLYADVDSANGGATVMKYDGNAWVTVGNRHFSSGFVRWPVMAIDRNNIPYVVYENIIDNQHGGKATVMKFDGNNWVTVGGDFMTDGVTSCTAIAIDSNNVPYVAYSDSLLSRKASVKKFNGTNWELVGQAGFSEADAGYHLCHRP